MPEEIRQLLLTQGQIESEIIRLSSDLEDTTHAFGAQAEMAAMADARWKREEAKLMLVSTRTSEGARRADALVRSGDAYTNYRVAEAISGALQEKCRSLRAQLGALQTLSANVRSQT